MRNAIFALVLAWAAIMVGCGKKFEANPNYSEPMMQQRLQIDEKYCHDLSRGITPVPPVNYAYIPDQRFNYSGNITYNNRNYNYNGTGYVDNSSVRAQQGAQNLGFAIGYAISVSRKENQCLEHLGWKKKEHINKYEEAQIKFNGYWEQLYKIKSEDEYREKVMAIMSYHISQLSYSERIDAYYRVIEKNGKSLETVYEAYRNDIINIEKNQVKKP